MTERRLDLIDAEVLLVGFILAVGLGAAGWAQWTLFVLSTIANIIYVGGRYLDRQRFKRRVARIRGRCEHGLPLGESCYRCDRKKVR
jgi:hypothetical protein